MLAALALLLIQADIELRYDTTTTHWSLGGKPYDPTAKKACTSVKGKTLRVQAPTLKWGEALPAVQPLLACAGALGIGDAVWKLDRGKAKTIVVIGRRASVWHAYATTPIDLAYEPNAAPLKALAPVAIYLAADAPLGPSLLARLVPDAAFAIGFASPWQEAEVRALAGEAVTVPTAAHPAAEGTLARSFGAAATLTPVPTEIPLWTNLGSLACVGDDKTPVAWATGVASGIKNAALAMTTADNRARSEMVKMKNGVVVSKDGTRTFSSGTLSGVQIVDRITVNETTYSLAQATLAALEMDAALAREPCPGGKRTELVWKRTPIDPDGGPLRAAPEWAQAPGLTLKDGRAVFVWTSEPRPTAWAANADEPAARKAFATALDEKLNDGCAKGIGEAIAAKTRPLREWNDKEKTLRLSYIATLESAACTTEQLAEIVGTPPAQAPEWVTTAPVSDAQRYTGVGEGATDAAAQDDARSNVRGASFADWGALLPPDGRRDPVAEEGHQRIGQAINEKTKIIATWRDAAKEKSYALASIDRAEVAAVIRTATSLSDAVKDAIIKKITSAH